MLSERLTVKKERLTSLALFFCVALSVVHSDLILHSALIGLKLCGASIIPAVFPFMIISDLIVAYSPLHKSGLLKRCFRALFGINPAGITAFLSGIICGFPLGVKSTVDLYREGAITKDEAERLIGFSNNTGPAFLVAGIGASMRGSVREGILLYASMVLSAILVGVLFRKRVKSCRVVEAFPKNHFDFTESIRNAASNTITVCSYIIFFSVIVGIVSAAVKSTLALSFILPFIEVGNAASFLANAKIDTTLSLGLTALAASFSGLSVHFQAMSFISGSGIRSGKYFVMKLFQGVFAFAIILIFESII